MFVHKINIMIIYSIQKIWGFFFAGKSYFDSLKFENIQPNLHLNLQNFLLDAAQI